MLESSTVKLRKSEKIQLSLSIFKARSEEKVFTDYFEVKILKAYQKPFTRCVEEGTFICSHEGEILNSKSEWHQAKVIRTTTMVVQGGAEVGRGQGGGPGAGQEGEGGGDQAVSQQGDVQQQQQVPRVQRGRAERAQARGQ